MLVGKFSCLLPICAICFFSILAVVRRTSDGRDCKKVTKKVNVSEKSAKIVLLAYEHYFGSKKCHIFQWWSYHDHILHIAGSRAHESIYHFYLLTCICFYLNLNLGNTCCPSVDQMLTLIFFTKNRCLFII